MLLKRTILPAIMLASTLFYSSSSLAQLISGDAFLQGNYMEVGVAPNGSFGTANNAPAGYHARVTSGDFRLGFVADPAKDGWTTGTPAYIGDYFLPGAPQEGWDVQVNGSRAKAWGITGPSSFTGGMTGATTDVRTIGSNKVALWEGKFGDLSIVQVTKLPVDSLYFTVSVRLKNTGSSTLTNIYYNRTVDPDNEATLHPIMGPPWFNTINKIEHQLPNPAGKVMVSACGVDYNSFLGLGTVDCRAKSYILNTMSLSPSASLDDLYAQTGGASIYKYTSGYKDTIDVGIGIVFNIGSLAPGDSTILSYSYVLGLTELDSAFTGISPFFVASGLPYSSGDTVKSCKGDTVNLAIANTSLSSWTWSPSGLSAGGGLANKIIVGNTAERYRVKGISGACSYPDTLWLTVSPYSVKPALLVSGPALSVSGGYSSYEWYHNTVVIPGATSSSYTTTSTGDYYVKVKDAHGCVSYSDTVHIITTSIDQIETIHYDVNIYPNPAKEKIFVASAYPVKVSVRDLTGRILLEQSNLQEIDISAYSDGLYLFVVKSEDDKIVTVKKINKMTK